jgi:hypothetical protein
VRTRSKSTKVLCFAAVAALNLAAVLLPPQPPSAPFASSASQEDGTQPEFPGPYDWGVIAGVPRQQPADEDVRVTRAPVVGDPAACQIQSETSVIADGRYVYVGFNDRRDCTTLIGASWIGFARSEDGGESFVDLGPLPPSPAVGDLYGDPVLAVDTSAEGRGTLYLGSLSSLGLALGVSTDRGKSFEWRTVAPAEGYADKEWLAVDNTGGRYDGRLYLAWINLTPDSGGEPHLDLSYSDDSGKTWSPAVTLARGAHTGVRVATGPRGEVHAVWEDVSCFSCPRKIHHSVSVDGGKSFSKTVVIAEVDPTGHEQVCTFTRRVLDGEMRTQEFPSLAIDTHGSPRNNPYWGTVYVVFSDHGTGDDESDVYMSYLPRGKGDWAAPRKVNDDDTATDQFFPEIASTGPGTFAVTWTDRREDEASFPSLGNRLMRQYVAFGSEGGAELGKSRPHSDVMFPPPYSNPNIDPLVSPCYAGDYNGLYSDGVSLYSSWADQRDDLLVTGVPSPVIPDPNIYFRKTRL